MLMFRRWDARRRIRQETCAPGTCLSPRCAISPGGCLPARTLSPRSTERELVLSAAGFLRSRGFESQDASPASSSNSRRGRMWVFSDAGTTAAGERLYAFTHRTFLEYFAAAYLAYDSDTPEQLALTHRTAGGAR